MSLQHSRSMVVPTLWRSVFDRDFARIEHMLAPGALWETFPPFVSAPLPVSGVFDVDDTLRYFEDLREQVFSDARNFDLKHTSQGEHTLTARYVTQGRDDKGPFDVSHTLFLEFDPQSDKIQRGVEYLDSESMKLHLKRDADKKEWEAVQAGEQQEQKAVKAGEQPEQKAVEGSSSDQQQPQAQVQTEASQSQSKEQSQA